MSLHLIVTKIACVTSNKILDYSEVHFVCIQAEILNHL